MIIPIFLYFLISSASSQQFKPEDKCTFDEHLNTDCSEATKSIHCGYYANDAYCESPPCFKEYDSRCSACFDGNVENAVLGKCPERKSSNDFVPPVEPDSYFCTFEDREKTCEDEYDGLLCGLDKNRKKLAMYESICEACLNPAVVEASFTECNQQADTGKVCKDEDRGKKCDNVEIKQVCGIKREKEKCPGDDKSPCYETYENECLACQDPNVNTVMPKCDDWVYNCKSADRDPNKDCPEISGSDDNHFNLVCGHYDKDFTGNETSKTFKNSCQACKDANIYFVEKGSCEESKEELTDVPQVEEKPDATEDDVNSKDPEPEKKEVTGKTCSEADRQADCKNAEKKKVCGFKSVDEDNDGTNDFLEFNSICEACLDKAVENVLFKTCDQHESEMIISDVKIKAHKCSADDRKKKCTDSIHSQKACAIYKCDKNPTGICPNKEDGVCSACLTHTNIYVVNENCEAASKATINFPCDEEDRKKDCTGVKDIKVCGFKNKDTYSSFENSCKACKHEVTHYFTFESCPGDPTPLSVFATKGSYADKLSIGLGVILSLLLIFN